eukprot:TRINITY_DN8114_c0_g3_i2.p1 TRINITY_DN8114_c0_g3~~TRINITY_DN8114_c0_g3_i2.p1  ORF type:complete len:315 (-),score=36.65 TRINITY_DN8114_c0_g3_i2:303-1175(-)
MFAQQASLYQTLLGPTVQQTGYLVGTQLVLSKCVSSYSKIVGEGQSGVAGVKGASAYLQNPQSGAEIFLVGVDHVSEDDVTRVQEVIKAVKPRTVVLQLDEDQQKELVKTKAQQKPFSSEQPWWKRIIPPLDQIALYGPLLGSNYMDEAAKGNRVPGEEQLAAAELGRKMGAFIVNGEQSTSKLFEQVGADIPWWRLRHLSYRISKWKPDNLKDVDDFKLKSSPQLYKELRQLYKQRAPKYYEIFFDSREEYLVQGFKRLTGRVVMPIGWQHIVGLVDRWSDAFESKQSN